MYSPDVMQLKQFYASPLGEMVTGQLGARLAAWWPHVSGESTLGLGFAISYATADAQDLAGMPAAQGALYWPADGANRAVLLDDTALPFPANSFNRVVLVHALEHSPHPQEVLREVWRVLVPGGRVMLVVPNRLGVWSHAHSSPFGSGRPFSVHELRDLLEQSDLTPLRHGSALFFLPSARRWMLAMARTCEVLGQMFLPAFGGVLVVEAEKQIYAAIREPVRGAVRARIKAAVAPAHPAQPVG